VTPAAQELKNDMLYDFKELKNVVHRVVIDKWDHQTMNDFFEAPTAERMAEAIYCMLQTYFQGTDLFVTKVRLWETEDCCATVGI
jgi:6-pyruvoyl-tetrahydropterin synthase